MTYACKNLLHATETATACNGIQRHGPDGYALKDPNVIYWPERYPKGTSFKEEWPWGVGRWMRYPDRPDLGWIFGGFVWLKSGRVY